MRSGWALWTSRSSGYSELSSGGRAYLPVCSRLRPYYSGGGAECMLVYSKWIVLIPRAGPAEAQDSIRE